MIKKIFSSRTKGITASAYILVGAGIISAILGLFRDRILAGTFGAGINLDIYFAAFRIPNLVFGLLISGGIIAAFMPVFFESFALNKEKGWQLANNIINCFLVFSILICGLLFLFAPYLVSLVVPGFDTASKELTITLTRIMLLSPILFGLSNIFASILQYFNRFLVYSLSPILYNLGIIFGILFLYPIFGIYGLAYGVILGALFHWLIRMFASYFSGFSHKLIFNIRTLELKKVLKLMIPRTIGAVSAHINLIIITAIASTLAVGSIAVFNFSDNLRSLPIGIIGASWAIAAYPFLIRDWVGKRKQEFLKRLSSTFRQTVIIILPLSFLFFLLRAQIVRIVLGTGKFDWGDTQLTAAALGLFSLGILAHSLVPLLVRVFWSFQDTKTPLFAGLASIAINISLAFYFIWLLRFPNVFQAFLVNLLDLTEVLKILGPESIAIIGLPIALSLAGIFQVLLLLIFLHRKIGDFHLKKIFISLFKSFLASIVMAFGVYFTLQIMANIVDMKTGVGILIQMVSAILTGVLIYVFMAHLLKLSEVKTLLKQLCFCFKKQELDSNGSKFLFKT